MEVTQDTKNDHNKKRPSNVLRACWECKKRKLQNHFAAADHDCGCRRGSMNSSRNAQEPDACSVFVAERLGKLEQFFEKIICRKPSNVGTTAASSASRSPTLAPSEPEQDPKMGFGILPEINSQSHNIASIGEGIVNWKTGLNQSLGPEFTDWKSAPPIRTLNRKTETEPVPNCETIRRSLAALLPSQHDANVIFESTNGWTILQTMYQPSNDLFVNCDPQSYALDMIAVAKGPAVIIARTLLHLAICITSLPPDFEASRLTNIWSLDATAENYVTTVTALATSTDEMLCTLHGLETLLLLSIYHLDNASLRQAWLVVRRAMSLAQLMGFHLIITRPSTSPPIATIESAKIVWRGLVDAETYIGLHLRLPFASDEYPIPENAEHHNVHRAKLTVLSRQIAQLDRNVTPQTYVQALALDEKLETLMKEMSKEFWDVPNVPSTARSPESSSVLERLVGQIWHFELKIIVHLPFLLRAPNESRYEYSKITALSASRNAILRWFALRNASMTQACCRFAELGVFIATVTLGLDILIDMGTKDRAEVQKARGSDFAMVCRVIGEMEKLAKSSPREKIAARSAVVIKKLMCSLDPSRRITKGARLTIPFFGTIEMAYHQPPFRPAFDLDSDTTRKLNSTAHSVHNPVFSFVRNELWPTFGAFNSDPSLDFDIVLYDGLEDKDLEGNWVF